ncbi:MAG: hypothetical protein HY092_00080 [Candidatus Kerfeldbacteria bacterium]|nr:hypothetical protein [Candidatus Kerfeldbacteria bacterium]
MAPQKSWHRRPARRPKAIKQPYHPYDRMGEVFLLVGIAVVAALWLVVPVTFPIRLAGVLVLFFFIPKIVIEQWWPKLSLATLGWQRPSAPRQPFIFALIIILLGLAPAWFFFTVSHPERLVAVSPVGPWGSWVLAEVMVTMILIAEAAFFAGYILFRLSHLLRPWVAIVIVGLLLAMTQMFLPGAVKFMTIPVTLALTWIAWQTESFVPAAVMLLLISLTFDLCVRLT